MRRNGFLDIVRKLLVSTLVVCTPFLHAQIPENSGQAIQQFFEYQYKQLFEVLPIGQDDLGALLATEQKIDHFERIHDRIDAGVDQFLTQTYEASKQKNTLQDYIDEAEATITKIQEEIDVAQKNIADINSQLFLLSNKIDDLEVQIRDNKKQLKDYILLSYKSSQGLFYQDETQLDILQALLVSSSDIGSSLLSTNTNSLLSHVADSMMARNKDLVDQEYTVRNQIKALKDEKMHHKFRLTQFQKQSQVQAAYKKKLFEIASDRQSVLAENYAKGRDAQEKVLAEVSELRKKYDEQIESITTLNNCEIQSNEVCDYIDKYYLAEKQLRETFLGREKIQFIWPVKPSSGISSYYRDPEYQRIVGDPHYGIDIPVPQGTEIVAPASGYILYMHAPRLNDYGYLAIKHPDGFITVYGHLSEILVDRFDFVKQGQVFAKSGGEPGTPGSGNITTGPHLHMEVYLKESVIDPLRYLDMTVFPEEWVTKKYRYKYYLDRLARDPETNWKDLKKSIGLFYIEGDTEIERQQKLIEEYAGKDFSDWETWATYSIEGGIDPAFTMCIGFAESGLGKNLTTGYNVGNVGNTDSGDRREYPSAQDGIEAIVATLNGKFLGKYTKMSQLSGWGNPDGTIYASSTVNWHENMTTCLSALKREFVSDDYEYRLPKQQIDAYNTLLDKQSG